MATVLDFSAAIPSARDIKAAGHSGAVMYISPAREAWMKAKPVQKGTIQDFKNHGLQFAFVWQYGKEQNPDVMRGHAGGVADAKAAQKQLDKIGCSKHPVFFAVDFDITLSQWNSTAVQYFKGVNSVLGKDRTGIYGHSRVISWSKEDKVVAEVSPGRVLGWTTKSWSYGDTARDYSVLYQGTHNVKGPSGVLVDINTIYHSNWGQKPVGGGNTTSPKTPQKTDLKKNSGYIPTKPQLCYPMDNSTYTRTSGYGERWGSFHAGIDLAAPEGTPIYAAADGVIIEGKDRTNVQGFGSWIWLDAQKSVGKDFIYGHVKHSGILVKAGDRVHKGQKIGVVGNEGQSTGPHLHFEVWSSPGRVGGHHENPDPFMHGSDQPALVNKRNTSTAHPIKKSTSNKGHGDLPLVKADLSPLPASAYKNAHGINTSGIKPNPRWRGDPVFLPKVLKAFGCKVQEYGDWKNIGHGDFGAIKGVFAHHTGTNKDIPGYIQNHPQLGLCAQVHLTRSGVWQIVGAGIAYHAGLGSYPGWPTNNANQVAIGIEAASDGITPWSAQQLDSYYRGCAAILWYLGKNADTQSLLAHWEYSKNAQGKWDPGAGNGKTAIPMDMNNFRRNVQKYINAARNGGNTTGVDDMRPEERAALNEVKNLLNTVAPKVKTIEERQKNLDKKMNDLIIQVFGPTQEERKKFGWETNPQGGRGWKQLGEYKDGRWLNWTDSLAAMKKDVQEIGNDINQLNKHLEDK